MSEILRGGEVHISQARIWDVSHYLCWQGRRIRFFGFMKPGAVILWSTV